MKSSLNIIIYIIIFIVIYLIYKRINPREVVAFNSLLDDIKEVIKLIL